MVLAILLEKAMAPLSSTLAWKIPWMEEPGRLQSMGSPRVRHDWATSLSLFTFMHWRRKCNPLQCSCLENPRDGRAWWAAVSGVAQSQTQLKQLSSSSSSYSFKILICILVMVNVHKHFGRILVDIILNLHAFPPNPMCSRKGRWLHLNQLKKEAESLNYILPSPYLIKRTSSNDKQ